MSGLMMGFNWPWVLLLLPVLWRLPVPRLKSLTDSAITLPPTVARALETNTLSSPRRGAMLEKVLASLLLLVVAQPVLMSAEQTAVASGHAIALLVDVSASMARQDLGESRQRLELVQDIAGEFIAQRQGDRMALVVFGERAYIASPATLDLAAVQRQLSASVTGMAGRSTAIGDAIGLGVFALQDDPAKHKAMILLSDGESNSGHVSPLDAAHFASQRGVHLHTIALIPDRPDGNTLEVDAAALADIAQRGSGRFFRAGSAEELKQVYDAIDALERSRADSLPLLHHRSLGTPLLMLCLLLLLFSLLRERRA